MLKKIFCLSDQGAADLKKGIWASTAVSMSLIFPAGLLFFTCKKLYSFILNGNEEINMSGYIVTALILLLVIYAAHNIQYINTFILSYSESAVRRVTLAEKLRKLPLSFFNRKDITELTSSIMGDCTDLEHTFSHSVPQLFGSLTAIIFIGIGLFSINWKMAAGTLCVLPIAFLLLIGSKFLQDRKGLLKIEAKLKGADRVQEYLENIREIKSYGMEEEYLHKTETSFDELIKASLTAELTTGTMVMSAQGVLRLGFAIVTLVGIKLLLNGEIDFMIYLMFLFTVSRIYDPLSISLTQISEIFNALLSIERMKKIEEHPVQEGTEDFNPENYDIVFENVNFSYENGEQVLKNLSFTAKQGEITALAGPSGSGKSSAARLAVRFWDVSSGRITLGGQDIKKVAPETLLKSFSMVFQNVTLFNDTILENIRLGRKDASDEEVCAAAEAAQCQSFIKRFPKGYDTIIGENGAALSGGERQRISIARALLKDAPVILLDEATASLDVGNETAVQQALTALIKDKTVLMIAHRMRTVASADKIIILKDGSAVETGTPADLLKSQGLYYKMTQFQNNIEI